MEIEPASLFATLGHSQRLAIFRLLMRRYPDRLAAGEIAQVLDLRASTLSVYLSALREAGLIRQQLQFNAVDLSQRPLLDQCACILDLRVRPIGQGER